ncbi:diaminopimelate decarboxylase [Rugosibacter aromaticivorans]|uniref:Diaminopimelate decarboxylase n=1 Tax=Rugosibacter aromaticivorans TaxID=1565605 RepID=A0A0C5JBF2_9PROT|nr:diaminopimelate decarboxylase [Rugosibacter aromaticivorans]AJP49074.1 diaminopimelate decarboxylase [Rugosibacter aromaticivorans]TBR15773.1 MAG: diaminopimelate decarboxylase [Rugosibacter sp.]
MHLTTSYPDGLYIEGIALTDIATRFGTPCYVYSRAALAAAYSGYRNALDAQGFGNRALICYAVKANASLAILNLFANLGAGFDIVSGGELARVLAAGGKAEKIVFSGVGKSRAEMRAALAAGIHCFNVESASELTQLNAVAGELGTCAPISLRVNPNVDPKTHPYISTGLKDAKFGIAMDAAFALYQHAASLPHLAVKGIDCHIGSQLLDPAPAAEAMDKVLALADQLAVAHIPLTHIDVGGGMGIQYQPDKPAPTVADYLAPILAKLSDRHEQLVLEPGRSLVGNAGLLLTQVMVLKPGEEKNFAIVDAAMNDLMRPALYDAFHEIVKVGAGDTPQSFESDRRECRAVSGKPSWRTAKHDEQCWEIVGPVCESGDFLGHDRALALAEGDLLAILSAGAYGMAMASNYNTRPRAAEVMVDGDQVHLIRRREEVAELFALESVLPAG